MKKFILMIIGLISLLPYGISQDTLRVLSHDRVLVVTDPVKGEKSYPQWAVFPNNKIQVRKIRMLLTLACPDSLPCAHWDYLDHIFVRRQGGMNSPSLNFEIGRMLTPYGSIFERGWGWTWSTDVTDFSMILRDSVEVEYLHSGYEPNTVGWSLSVRFEVITGKPAIEPISITPMWTGSFRYGDPTMEIEKSLKPILFESDRKAGLARLRIAQTGHGMDEPRGCSEFCSRYRDIKFDGALIDHTNLWKECGINPLFPQGGTWIYDRGNWCPGDLNSPDLYDVLLKKGEHSFDLDMEPYIATGNIQANESIASYLIQYERPSASNDAAVEMILSPTDEQNQQRQNPVCSEPHIVIRNLGKAILHSVVIEYGSNNNPLRRHTWKGSLKFNETTDVWLEGPVKFREGKNSFYVRLRDPNGRKDAWPADNVMKSSFNAPVTLPEKLIVQFKSNERPADNKISIMDAFGGIQYIRESKSLKANTLYLDTLQLNNGCYELNLSDTSGNGLEFWFEPEQGYGFLRLLDAQGRLLHSFESDCGNGQHLAFRTIPDFRYDSTLAHYAFSVFPLRVKDRLLFDCITSRPENVTVIIKGSENSPVERHEFLGIRNQETYIDVNHLKPGRYFFEVEINGKRQYKKRFNKE